MIAAHSSLFSWSSMAIRLTNHSISSQISITNVRILHRTAAGVCSIIHRQQDEGRRESFRRQMLWLNGSSVPLSSIVHACNDSSLHRTHCQVPFILPYSNWICCLQEEMLVISNPRFVLVNSIPSSIMFVNPRPIYIHTASNSNLINVVILKKLNPQIRGFCGVANSDVESKGEDDNRLEEKMLADSSPRFIRVNSHSNSIMFVNPRANHILKNVDILKKSGIRIREFCRVSISDIESKGEDDEDNEGDDEFVRVKSAADEKEVERVCNIIDELFALDRNMEAVLDDSRVSLTHDLVVDVLDRFKHARRPAFRFFSWARQQPGFSHDSRTYNTMMTILGKTKQFEAMISLLDEMGEKRLLNLETFQICIKSFAAAQQRRKAVGIFELMKKHNFKVGVESINCLLDNLGRAKLGKEAQILFDKLKGRFTPNIQTYTVLLNGWCKVGNLLEAGKVWNEMVDKGLSPDVVAYNKMLEGLLKVHKRSDAVKLFEVMKAKGPSPNERSYTIMIRDLCKQKWMKDAVKYYEHMLDIGCKPDAAVYTCLITGFGNQKQMDKVYGLLKEMKEHGCPPDGRMYNALIKLMTNRQMSDDAVRLYKKMIQNGIEPTIHTYNMMLKSFFRNENYDMGLAVWEEMGQKGVCPDDNSYTVFIGGLVRQGRSTEACKYLEEMIEKGMKPPQLDYNKFAADFCRAGKPNILEELAQKMSLEGKVEVSDIFAGYAESLKKTGKHFTFVMNRVG